MWSVLAVSGRNVDKLEKEWAGGVRNFADRPALSG